MAVFCHSQPHAFLRCGHDRYDTIKSHLSQTFTFATVSVSVVRFSFSIIKQVVHLVITTFVTCCSALYFRSVCSKLIPIFCQSSNRTKMILHIGFLDLYMAVTTNDNISNQMTVTKITIYILPRLPRLQNFQGFLNLCINHLQI